MSFPEVLSLSKREMARAERLEGSSEEGSFVVEAMIEESTLIKAV